MALQVNTSNDAEGSDDLKEFLLKYKSSDLKNSFNPIYDKLKEIEIDLDDLLHTAAMDLRETLNEMGLAKIHIMRLINALRKHESSQVYKENMAKPVVVLSSQEENARINITNKSKEFKQNLMKITNIINELNINYKCNEDLINTQFDAIINIANTRRDHLLQKLREIKKNKNDKLMNQMNSIKEYDSKLVTAYDETEKLVHDTTVDVTKRKNKILAISTQILKGAEKWNGFRFSSTATINVLLDAKDVGNILSNIGDVVDPDKVKTPSINIKSVAETSIVINIKSDDDIIGYRLEYVEANNDDCKQDEDMKIEWKSIEVNDNNKDIDYNIDELKVGTNYMVRCLSRNEFGYSDKSKILRLRTKKSWKFNVITDGYERFIENNGKRLSIKEDICDRVTASYSKGFHSGIHEFKLKAVNVLNRFHVAVCIVAGDVYKSNKWISSHQGTHYYFNGNYGKIYCGAGKKVREAMKFKTGDMVTMTLNCDNWTLCFKVNNTSYEIDIEKNKTYYACICVTRYCKGVMFDIM